MGTKSTKIPLMFLIFLTSFQALGNDDRHDNQTVESFWQHSPWHAYVLDQSELVDRDGDGNPDLWRTFYPSGNLKTVSFNHGHEFQGPDTIYYYDDSKDLSLWSKKIELSRSGKTAFEKIVTEFFYNGNKRGANITYFKMAKDN